jgi:hypothetical protein
LSRDETVHLSEEPKKKNDGQAISHTYCPKSSKLAKAKLPCKRGEIFPVETLVAWYKIVYKETGKNFSLDPTSSVSVTEALTGYFLFFHDFSLRLNAPLVRRVIQS